MTRRDRRNFESCGRVFSWIFWFFLICGLIHGIGLFWTIALACIYFGLTENNKRKRH